MVMTILLNGIPYERYASMFKRNSVNYLFSKKKKIIYLVYEFAGFIDSNFYLLANCKYFLKPYTW